MKYFILLLLFITSNLQAGTSAFTAGSGSLTSTQVGYGSGTNKIVGESAFSYNDTTNTLSMGNATLNTNGVLQLNDADNSNYVRLQSPSVVGTNRTFVLPDSYGTSGQFLKTDGAGVMSWDTASGGGGGNPNLIINGGMDIWQRGTSFVSPSSDTVTVDRYRHSYSFSGAFTLQRSADVPTGSGLTYSTHIDVTTADASVAAGDYMFFGYLMEGQDLAKIKGKTFTLSFYVKSSNTGTHCVALRNQSANRSYVAEYSVAVADTWERKEITITHDITGTWNYDNTLGVLIQWQLMVGTNYNATANTWVNTSSFGTTNCNGTNLFDSTAKNFYITGIQVEVGSSASDFKTRGSTLNEEYKLAQRYFLRYNHENANTGFATCVAISSSAGQCLAFGESMRINPTISQTGTITARGPSGADIGCGTLSNTGQHTFGTIPKGIPVSYGVQISGCSGLTGGHATHLFVYTGSHVSFNSEL